MKIRLCKYGKKGKNKREGGEKGEGGSAMIIKSARFNRLINCNEMYVCDLPKEYIAAWNANNKNKR